VSPQPSPPRVRFAPSPTGYLHIGGARTALFNWLYARRHGGTFILRIEDTDTERSSDDMTAGILSSLRWLGLDWDEGPGVGGPHGPYLQSARRDRHLAHAQQLIGSGAAYYCYCTAETLHAKRAAAEAAGGAWMYDRLCQALSPREVAAREAAREPRVVRVLVPEADTSFDDQVHGRISVPHTTIEDFVIVRSDGSPTYQLSVVSDDIDMQVTHVVRGDDHISNTPKQILLYRALGAEVPTFAHVPLILGPDRKRLSKRHGATAVGEYEAQGYLADAMVNFLALLGWSPGSGDQELFTREDLVTRFTLEGISGGNAVFNPEKLDWFNQQYIAALSQDALVAALRQRLADAGFWRDDFDPAWLSAVFVLLKPRSKRLTDFVLQFRIFVADRVERDQDAVTKHLGDDVARGHLAALRERLATVDPFNAAALEPAVRKLAEERGVKAGALIHGARVAVTGQTVSPGIFEVLELVGRARVLARIDAALANRD
jgi:glutamyl-tRNA synthetase